MLDVVSYAHGRDAKRNGARGETGQGGHDGPGAGSSVVGGRWREGEDVKLLALADGDGNVRWYGPDGEDTGVAGKDPDEAIGAARLAWQYPAWHLDVEGT